MMLKNPATQPAPKWNNFTEFLRDNPLTIVKLRNGTMIRVFYRPAEDEWCDDGFRDEGGGYRWKTDGVSITSKDFDMMEIIQ